MRMLARDPGEVLVFSNSFSMLGHRQRVEGFQRQLLSSCPSLKVRKVIELPRDVIDTYQTVLDALQETRCRYVVYSGNAQAGIKAIKASGIPVTTIFYDLAPYAREALQQGDIDAVIFQNPQRQGARAVQILFEYLTANQLPAHEVELSECDILLRENFLPHP